MSRASAKAAAICRSVSPTHIDFRSDARFCSTSRPRRSARWRTNALLPVPGGPCRQREKRRSPPRTRRSASATGSVSAWTRERSNEAGTAWGGASHARTRERPCTPRRTASRPPPASRAAAVAPAATPGVAANSRARAAASSGVASMPWRSSCRAQIRARTAGVGGRNSRANIMRRRRAESTDRASFIVHRVGAGVRSSSRCMNTFEPPCRVPGAKDRPKSAKPGQGLESRSSISSKRRSERPSRATRRCASRSSWSLSSLRGSVPRSSASPTLYSAVSSRAASTLQNSVLPVPGGP